MHTAWNADLRFHGEPVHAVFFVIESDLTDALEVAAHCAMLDLFTDDIATKINGQGR
jgi:hypothetical protein